MVDTRYDAVIRDPGATGPAPWYVTLDSQGLMLEGGISWSSAQQMTSRVAEAIDYTSFEQSSVIEQSDWHHGRGLEKWDNAAVERFYDSYNVDTRIQGQVTLAPGQNVGQLGGEGYSYPGTGSLSTPAISASQKLGQGFQVASPGNITSVIVRISCTSSPAVGDTMTLRVETNNAGMPSGTLVHANATSAVAMTSSVPGTAQAHYEFSFTSFAISASTQYHLVLSHTVTGDPCLYWGGTTANSYANGAAAIYTSGAWAAPAYSTLDLFFLLPDFSNLAGTVSCFCQFNGKMYCGAGKGVYVWDETNDHWDASKTDFANNITDMVDFASLLWVAHSDGNLWTFNGTSTWTEKSGKTATTLLVYKGYLYRSTYSTDNQVWYTPDGTYWAATGAEYAWKIGNPGRLERITALAGYDFEVHALTTHGLYMIGPESEQGDLQDQIKDWSSQYDTDNGKGAVSWAKDGKLYIPVLGGLLSYSGGLFDSVGPDQDAGLPEDRQGNIVDLLSLTNWLVAAVDAGASKTSSVLVYNGVGWNELVRIPQSGQSCRALGYDTTVSPHRLWFGYGARTGWVELPDLTDNPYMATGTNYASSGYLITPWISYGLLGVEKDFHQLGMQYEMPTGTSIAFEYEVDRSGLWTPLFTLTGAAVGNVYVYDFPFSTVAAPSSDVPITAAGCTAKVLNVNTAVYLTTYFWLRISDEIRQMTVYNSDTQITLGRPLSAAPAAGVYCYPSRACGAEIRLRVTLSTTDTTVSPLLTAWWLTAYPMLNDKLAGRMTCKVYDGQTDRAGDIITPDAATRVTQLYSFANRATPIDVIDKRGTVRRCKITAINEVENKAVVGAPGHEPQVESIITLNVLEL